jgi:hypothetical protein
VNSRRDYKSVTTGPRRQRARRHGLLVVTLVLIGLFGGLLAYIKGDRTKPAPVAAVAPATPAQPAATPAAAPPKAVVAPVAEPAPVKPKYDFYTELPKRQIDIQPETVNPKSAPAPTRTQPAADPLRKPATPRKTDITPIMAAASARPEVKPASARPDTKPASARPEVKSASARPEVKSASARPEVKSASAPTPGTTLARTTQLPRPLADNSSKTVVKTERAP